MEQNKFSEVEIRKVKFNKRGGLDVTFVDNDFQTTEGLDPAGMTFEGPSEPVNRVKILFKRLVHHLLIVNEYPYKEITDSYIKNYKIVDDPTFKSFKVTSFIINGDSFLDPNAKVKLVGEKMLGSGEIVPLQTPFVRLYSDSEYSHSGNLQIDIDALIDETKEYLNGKVTPSNQLALAFDKKEDDDEESDV